MKVILHFIIGSLLIATIAGCSTWSKTAKGGAIGTAAGGAAGAIIGKITGNTAVGAIMGAAVGGVAGATIGAYMDKQAEELEADLEGATVERIGEGIKITFDSGILFGFDKYDLQNESKENIRNLAEILNKYEDTNILVEGHTDSFGSEEYNEKLSKRRAYEVYEYIADQAVDMNRMTVQFYGEEKPVANNETEAGRALNRRVEVAIFANEKLKKAAENGNLALAD